MQCKSWSQGWSFSHTQPPSATPEPCLPCILHCTIASASCFASASASANVKSTSSSHLTASNNIESHHCHPPRTTVAVGKSSSRLDLPHTFFVYTDRALLRQQSRLIATPSITHHLSPTIFQETAVMAPITYPRHLLPRALAAGIEISPQPQTLQARQLYFALPASYAGLDSGPSPGTVVGITVGTVAGFILLMWLIQSLIQNRGMQNQYIEGASSEIEVTRRQEPRRRRRKERRPQRSERSEQMSSISASTRRTRQPSRSPAPRRERSERIILEETRRTETSRPPPEVREERRETVTEERSRRVSGDDTVEVIEEESLIGERNRPRRSSRSGAYRVVDPGAYAGGVFAV